MGSGRLPVGQGGDWKQKPCSELPKYFRPGAQSTSQTLASVPVAESMCGNLFFREIEGGGTKS